jgi:hypothetical protein
MVTEEKSLTGFVQDKLEVDPDVEVAKLAGALGSVVSTAKLVIPKIFETLLPLSVTSIVQSE